MFLLLILLTATEINFDFPLGKQVKNKKDRLRKFAHHISRPSSLEKNSLAMSKNGQQI